MGDLLSAEPFALASLALRLRRAAAVVGALRTVEGPVAWRGQAAEAFTTRLLAVSRVLPRIEEAYHDSGRILLLYAGAVEEAQLLARRAAALRVEADRLSAMSAFSGPDPGDSLRITALRWESEAAEAHDAAARRAAAELDALADSAPRARRGASQERFWSDARSSMWSQLSATAGLVMTVGEALAGNRAARDELVTVAQQSWRVWEPVVEIYQQLADDRGGLAVAGGLGFLGGRGIRPVRASGGGTRSRVGDVELARAEAVQEGGVRHLIDVLGVDYRPYRPGDRRVGLFAHEAMNGHAIRQHVAKSLTFLRWRADRLRSKSASSFPDAMTAQVVLKHIVESRQQELVRLMEQPVGARWSGSVDMERSIGHGYVADDPNVRTTTVASATFARVDGGIVLVTLYPKVVP